MSIQGVSTFVVHGVGGIKTKRCSELPPVVPREARIRGYRPSFSSSSSRLSCSFGYGGCSDWRVLADGRPHCFLSNGQSAAKKDKLLRPKVGRVDATTPQDFEKFQLRGWSEAACDEGALLQNKSVGASRAQERFVKRRDITEENMDRLLDALLREEGQSVEDYRRRAIVFGKIAEFFSETSSHSTETVESPSSSAAEVRVVQRLVDAILAEEGRSPTDYNARAQIFARSAEVFPFHSADSRST